MGNLFIKESTLKIRLISIIGILGLLLFLLFYLLFEINFEISLFDSFVTTTIFTIFSISLWYPTNYRSLDNNSLVKVIFYNSIIVLIATSLWLYVSYFIVTTVFQEYEEFFQYTLVWRFLFGMLLFIIAIILNYAVIYYNNFTEKVISESNFNLLIAEAELKSLKYQINPHFLFNSLNSISSLTISDPAKAQEMSINLSEFLRKTLLVNDTKMILLSEEIESIKLYLKIEKVRFAERLDINFDINERCKNILIPNMILQPLIENAIKHGVYESSDKVSINISCNRKEKFIELIISNNYDTSTISNIGEGIGLRNINSRLKLIYNKSNLISIKKRDNNFIVTLLIPVDDNSILEN